MNSRAIINYGNVSLIVGEQSHYVWNTVEII